jgi:hypothetical protein
MYLLCLLGHYIVANARSEGPASLRPAEWAGGGQVWAAKKNDAVFQRFVFFLAAKRTDIILSFSSERDRLYFVV